MIWNTILEKWITILKIVVGIKNNHKICRPIDGNDMKHTLRIMNYYISFSTMAQIIYTILKIVLIKK